MKPSPKNEEHKPSPTFSYGTYASPTAAMANGFFTISNNKKMIKEYSQVEEDQVRTTFKELDENGEFIPLTAYSIAAAQAAARERQKSPMEEFKMDLEESKDDNDVLHHNTNNNRYANSAISEAGRMAASRSSAFGALVRRQSYPYKNTLNSLNNIAGQNSSSDPMLTNENMTSLMQQIGVNTVEAATVMMNLVQMREKKKSLAMVI